MRSLLSSDVDDNGVELHVETHPSSYPSVEARTSVRATRSLTASPSSSTHAGLATPHRARPGEAHDLAPVDVDEQFALELPNGKQCGIRTEAGETRELADGGGGHIRVCGRALPLLQPASDRDHLLADVSQNQLEEAALAAVIAVLPPGARPVVLADRGFARAPFFTFLHEQRVASVVRINTSTCLTDAHDVRTKLGDAGMRPGQVRWLLGVRFGLCHGRPRDLRRNVACCWRVAKRHTDPRRIVPTQPWYLATSLRDAGRAVA